jgi:hypothetical protein
MLRMGRRRTLRIGGDRRLRRLVISSIIVAAESVPDAGFAGCARNESALDC